MIHNYRLLLSDFENSLMVTIGILMDRRHHNKNQKFAECECANVRIPAEIRIAAPFSRVRINSSKHA